MTEPEISHVVYLKSNCLERVTMTAGSIYPYLQETLAYDVLHKSTSNELPTCPVCLERMDESITGLMSIQCHHTSQCYCLEKWGNNQCPVCRYSHKPVSSFPPSSSSGKRMIEAIPTQEDVIYECCVCDSTESLWICMICGHIGCGRYQEAHAYDHYTETNHLYALEIETQRVWDYKGDGYVHRLIQNTIDGALVELPSSQARETSAPEQTPNGKLDTLSVDYSYMLTSQLDSQRMYLEDQLAELTSNSTLINNQIQTLQQQIDTQQEKQSTLLEKRKTLDHTLLEMNKEKEKSEKRALSFKEKFNAMQKHLNEEKEVCT